MASTLCPSCGKTLNFIDRIAGGTCGPCRKKASEAAAASARQAQSDMETARSTFPARLRSALEDGQIDTWEREELDALARTGQISPSEVRRLSLSIYEEARQQAVGDRILTQDEYDSLMKLQAELGIPTAEISKTIRELTRLRLLTEIRDGLLPEDDSAHVMLKAGETCHFETTASLVEEKTVSRTVVTDSTTRNRTRSGYQTSGFGTTQSDLLMKNFDVRTSHETANKAFVPIDSGTMTITSHRVVFTGQREAATIPYEKLASVGLSDDRIRLGVEGRKSVYSFDVSDGEMLAAMLSQASKTYHNQFIAVARVKAPRTKKATT